MPSLGRVGSAATGAGDVVGARTGTAGAGSEGGTYGRAQAKNARTEMARCIAHLPSPISHLIFAVPPCPRSAAIVCRSTDLLAPLGHFCSSARRAQWRLRYEDSAGTTPRDKDQAIRQHGDVTHLCHKGRGANESDACACLSILVDTIQ